jgi:hypothetical protein
MALAAAEEGNWHLPFDWVQREEMGGPRASGVMEMQEGEGGMAAPPVPLDQVGAADDSHGSGYSGAVVGLEGQQAPPPAADVLMLLASAASVAAHAAELVDAAAQQQALAPGAAGGAGPGAEAGDADEEEQPWEG